MMTSFGVGSEQLEFWFVSSSFANGVPQQNQQQQTQQMVIIDLLQEITFTICFLYRYAIAENIVVV